MVARRRPSPVLLGAALLALIAVALPVVYLKDHIATALSPGTDVTAEFARGYRLVPDKSEVKMAGVVVGTVSDVEAGPQGRSVVTMRVSDDAADRLGSAPAAAIRPTTLLGGDYYAELTQGGGRQPYDGRPIPVRRTHIPVELDQILATIPSRAQDSIRGTTRQVDDALRAGAGDSLGRLLDHAPGTLRPAGDVLRSARGTRPDTDLWRLVPDLSSSAAAMARQRGQLGRVVDSLGTVSGTLSHSGPALADSFRTLPDTLTSTDEGLTALRGSLDRLSDTSARARPIARQLDPLLAKADPVVRDARPLMTDLRGVLDQARPTTEALVPTARDASAMLGGIKGPVLHRLNGPITRAVLSPWRGSGPYAGDGGNGHRFYEELGYTAAHMANLSQYRNKNGPMLGLALGMGSSSIGGNDPGTARLLRSLGLLPGGGFPVLPTPDSGNDQFSPQQPNAAGQGSALTGPLGPLLPGLLGGPTPRGH